MNRVAIGMPSRGDVVAETTMCLARLVGHEVGRGQQLSFICPTGSLVCFLREDIVERAFAQGATHLLFIDSDMTFPPDGLARLLAHGEPIVGCNYPTRTTPAWPTAMREEGRLVFDNGEEGLEEVWVMGLGFCLVELDVFRRIPRPWFSMTFEEFGQRRFGEDYSFFRNAPFPALLDHDLSREIGHIGYHHFTHADMRNEGGPSL